MFKEALFAIFLVVTTQNTRCLLGDNVLCRKPREFRLSLTDAVLVDNVIASYEVSSQAECLFRCHKNKGCQSYNYQFTLRNTDEIAGLCEINNKTLKSCPLKKSGKEGHGYYEETNIDEIYELYGSEKNPGMSCLDIKDCQLGNDGEYWLSSEQTSWSIVKVFCYMNTTKDSNAINVAKDKPAIQSSTNGINSADRAVDGKRTSHFFHGSCTETAIYSTSPWWRVDLQNVFFIRKLIITNRSDCCSERLSNFQIKIGLSLANNGNSNPACGGFHSLKAETKSIVCPQSIVGRYVNIIIPGQRKILALCEVEVYS